MLRLKTGLVIEKFTISIFQIYCHCTFIVFKNKPALDPSQRDLNMKSQEQCTDKFREVLERLTRREIVQNRQLKTFLGTEGYARYLSDCEYQKHLRVMLKDKPDEIVEYERLL